MLGRSLRQTARKPPLQDRLHLTGSLTRKTALFASELPLLPAQFTLFASQLALLPPQISLRATGLTLRTSDW